MKKVSILAIAAVGMFLASCTKDYTCTCTTEYTGGGTSTATTVYYKTTQNNAAEKCMGSQTTITSVAGTTVGNKTTCDLK